MAIKNKDGTIYRLRGPNPLLKDQNRWKINEVQFFNFSWQDITIPSKKQKIFESIVDEKVNEKTIPKIGITEVIKKRTEKEIEIQIDEIQKKVVIESKLSKDIEQIIQNNKSIFVCLPVRINSYKDDLYGDSYKTTTFGNKFTFEGILIDRGNFGVRIWSPRLINQGSVICHDPSDQLHDRDWWKVENTHEYNGGYIVSAGISDYSPDMS